MSIACCRIPNFLFAMAAQGQSQWAENPTALLGSDECVWATSLPASASGVQVGMTARQARSRCADVVCRPLDLPASESAQHYFLDTLAGSGLPVESQDWGMAYIDLRLVSDSPQDASLVCAQLGSQVRAALGNHMAPALGCDSGKFTAHAAAIASLPGRLQIVDRASQARFLNPLPVTWLPLPMLALQQLSWLGIRTLGQFATLPVASVMQRFGESGKLALNWARGHDERPVRATAEASPQPIEVDLDAPTQSYDVAVNAAMATLTPHLKAMAVRLEGCRRLRVALRFLDGSDSVTHQTFVEPLSQITHVQAALRQMLQHCVWPAELAALQITVLDVGELRPQQLALFTGAELGTSEADRQPFAKLVNELTARYSKVFLSASLTDERHVVPERRFSWLNL